MEIRADAVVSFPRDLVFATYRDDVPKLVPLLSNVRSVEVTSRREEGSIVEVVNEWRGGGDVPAALRALLSESALGWTDYASWNSDTWACDWRNETAAFKDAMRCSGRSTFAESGPGATRIETVGTLDLDARKIRGVPGFLAGTIGRNLEEFLVSKIRANLVELARAVGQYLESRKTTD